jgi:hypothetical protein
VPADEFALVGVGLLLDGVIDYQDGRFLAFLFIKLAHRRLDQEAPQGGRVELFASQKASYLVVAYGPSRHGREASGGGVGKGAQEVVGIEFEKIFVHMWLTLLHRVEPVAIRTFA